MFTNGLLVRDGRRRTLPYRFPLPRDEEALARQFGGVVKRLRDAKGFNQRDAARLIGILQARVAGIERGVHPSTGRPTIPPAELVARMAASYGYPKE